MLKAPTKCLQVAIGLIVLFVLSACEAPLNLEGVAAQQEQAVLRFDMFQGLATHGQRIVAVSSTGAALVSDDLASSWKRFALPENPTLIDIAACPDGRFVALDTGRRVWVLDGETWSTHPIDTTENTLSLTCDPQNRFWVGASFSSLLMSADGGESWELTSFDEDLQFTEVQFFDADSGVAVGEFGMFIYTEDGGASWEFGNPIPNEFYPMAAAFLDRQTGWVGGLDGVFWATRDGGESWERQTAEKPTPIYGITAMGGEVFAAGESGTVYRWDGSQWKLLNGLPMLLAYVRGVLPLGEDKVLIAGGGGTLMTVAPDASSVASK